MLCGYDFTIAVKSVMRRGNRRNQETYELQVKVAFDEDPAVLTSTETEEINIGVMVAPQGDSTCHFIMEMKCTIRRSQLDSGWKSFEKTLKKDEYTRAFRGGFSLKIFDFSDV